MKYRIVYCTKYNTSWYQIEQKGGYFSNIWLPVTEYLGSYSLEKRIKEFPTEKEAEEYVITKLAPENAPTKKTTVKILTFN